MCVCVCVHVCAVVLFWLVEPPKTRNLYLTIPLFSLSDDEI